jgi:hypothetical protein
MVENRCESYPYLEEGTFYTVYPNDSAITGVPDPPYNNLTFVN